MNSPLDESEDQEEDLTMTYAPITKAEWDEIERIAADRPDRVTITTTPDVHAAQEALNVAVFRLFDTEGSEAEKLDRIHWYALLLRNAMEEAATGEDGTF